MSLSHLEFGFSDCLMFLEGSTDRYFLFSLYSPFYQRWMGEIVLIKKHFVELFLTDLNLLEGNVLVSDLIKAGEKIEGFDVSVSSPAYRGPEIEDCSNGDAFQTGEDWIYDFESKTIFVMGEDFNQEKALEWLKNNPAPVTVGFNNERHVDEIVYV